MLNHSNTYILYKYKHSDATNFYTDKLIKSFIAKLVIYRFINKIEKPKATLNIIDFILKSGFRYI